MDRDGGDRGAGTPQIYRLGDHQVSLPSGVTIADWSLERLRIQNPRIRSLLGCIRNLEAVLDSNYAILHCSPQRLHEIWGKVLRIADLVRNELRPLLAEPSCIPPLEKERLNTVMALELLESSVLCDLDQFPAAIDNSHLMKVRKLLCVAMGKLHAFLQDAFARIVAADPRSRYDADYFLSRRFPHDVEEAEWLWMSVAGLKRQLGDLHAERIATLVEMAQRLESDYEAADENSWLRLQDFLESVRHVVTPRLREILSQRGIRFDEMEALDRYASELPTLCTLITEIGDLVRAHHEELTTLPAADGVAREVISATQLLLQGATNRRLSSLMVALDERLRDLEAFIPFWLEEIGRRRALMLKPVDESDQEVPPTTASSDEEAGKE